MKKGFLFGFGILLSGVVLAAVVSVSSIPTKSSGDTLSADEVNQIVGTLEEVSNNEGHFGIGTPTPNARLTVVDDDPDNGWNTAAFHKPTAGPHWSHVQYGATGDWYIRSSAGNGKVVLQDHGGFVGIGTAAPTANLHVNGSIRSGEMVMDGGSTFDFAGRGHIASAEHIYLLPRHPDGNVYVSGAWKPGGSRPPNLQVDGMIGAGGMGGGRVDFRNGGTDRPTLYVRNGGTANPQWTAIMEHGSGNGKGLLIKAGAGSANSEILLAQDHLGHNRFVVRGQGNVGIGTINPESALDVHGAIRHRGSTNVSSREYKKNIDAFSSEDYQRLMEDLQGMDLVRFHYDNEDENFPRNIGVIAEEMPEAYLSEDKKGVKSSSLLFSLLGAIKVQQEQIELLQNEIDTLKTN